MQRFRDFNKTFFSKLTLINLMVIGIVLFVAALSIKEYACILVNQQDVVGPKLNQVLSYYLIIVSVIAFLFAGAFHFYFVRKMTEPLKELQHHAGELSKGNFPEPLKVAAKDEVGELTVSFNSMVSTLKQVEMTRDHMLKDISHELRTPITNLNGYLEALKNGVINGDKDLYSSLYEESQRVTRLIEQLTDLGKWRGHVDFNHLTFHSFEVSDLIKDTVQLFNLSFDKKGIAVKVACDLAKVSGDVDGIKQVLSNLLQNVLDYDIGGEVSIKGMNKEGHYRVEIKNKGQYIEPSENSKVFERFYRMDESREKKTEGAGLGLSIAKEIIVKHDGLIGVETNGEDHLFWFELPKD